MWFYSVDYAVILYKGCHRMEYLICLINVNVIELKVDLLHWEGKAVGSLLCIGG